MHTKSLLLNMIADSGRFSEIASRYGVLDPDPELIQSGAFKSADEAGSDISGHNTTQSG